MKENIKLFNTLVEANCYAIKDIPFVGYERENELVLYCSIPNLTVFVLNEHLITRTSVNIIFNTLLEADEYIIEEIPFSCYIKENEQFLECNLESCKIVVENGVAVIVEYMRDNEIWYTSTNGNVVTPYRASALPTIVSNTYVDGKGVIKFVSDVTSIEYSAFYNRSGLTSIEIPNSVTSIGDHAFYGCSGLTSVTIGDGVTSIGNRAFNGCTSLTSINIPNSVTSIEDLAFYQCSGLTSIVVESGNSVYDSRNDCNAIIETATNTLIKGCQNSIIPNNVTNIGQSAFGFCSGLTSIEIPNSVTSIEGSAFYYCTSLTSIVIANSVTTIGDSAFQGCSSLTTVNIPNKIVCIKRTLFSDCASLASLTIPDSVITIEDGAILNCTGLTSLIIPNSVISIGLSAFNGCSGLTSATIGNSVTSIKAWAFSGCYRLNSISYTGTITQWNTITKGTKWHNIVPATVIHCSDGDTPI